jgi:hypothetical protein
MVALSATSTAQTPVRVDAEAVLALAETPWRDRDAFLSALDAALGGVQPDMPRLSDALRDADPFLWSITGTFGAPVSGRGVTGGIVVCSRYGLATRDRLAERTLSDPRAFALFAATQAAHDDAALWPETGIARLACMITWNDTRRVAILPEQDAQAALAPRFDTVRRLDEGDLAGAGGPTQPPRFGAAGYRLSARQGRSDSVVWVESARIDLRMAHQEIRFRAYLLNGGM